jgi:hypothetical protein
MASVAQAPFLDSLDAIRARLQLGQVYNSIHDVVRDMDFLKSATVRSLRPSPVSPPYHFFGQTHLHALLALAPATQ